MAIVSLVATGFLFKARAQSVIQDLEAKAEDLTAPLTETKDKLLEEVAKFDHQSDRRHRFGDRSYSWKFCALAAHSRWPRARKDPSMQSQD
jgi:hypothetical protein